MFSIWPVKEVDEAIEILTGIEAGKLNEQEEFPEGSLNFICYQKLWHYHKIVNNESENEEE
jgi:hypothetical protein